MANEPLKTAVVTNVGVAKLDAAYQAGEKVIISEMALGDSNLAYVVPDPAFTELVNEFGRQDINEGNTTDSWLNAIVYVDSQQFAGKSILEFGLYDEEGDLIVYSSYTPSVVPAVGQDYIQLEIECSVDLYNASAVTIEVTPILPQATELERGIAKVATDADVAAGVDDEKIVTSKKLADQYLKTSDLIGLVLPDSALVPMRNKAFLADGSSYLVEDYPKLMSLIQGSPIMVAQALINADPETYAACYGVSADGLQFTVPNYTLRPHLAAAGVFGTAGSTVEDQIELHAHATPVLSTGANGLNIANQSDSLLWGSTPAGSIKFSTYAGTQTTTTATATLSSPETYNKSGYTEVNTSFVNFYIIHGESA